MYSFQVAQMDRQTNSLSYNTCSHRLPLWGGGKALPNNTNKSTQTVHTSAKANITRNCAHLT